MMHILLQKKCSENFLGMNEEQIYKHLFDREYMSGVNRERTRVKSTGEVFTPTPLVEEILDKMNPELFSCPTKTLLDPTCGDGQFLASVLYRKIKNGIDFETALSTIYGADLMIDNVDLCRERLLCGREDLRYIVEKNIQCKNGLSYGYKFEAMGPARRKVEERLRNKEKKLQLKRQKAEEELRKLKEREKTLKKLFPDLKG